MTDQFTEPYLTDEANSALCALQDARRTLTSASTPILVEDGFWSIFRWGLAFRVVSLAIAIVPKGTGRDALLDEAAAWRNRLVAPWEHEIRDPVLPADSVR